MPDTITAPAETPQQPSLEERVAALKGEAFNMWKFEGADIAAAEAKNSEIQPQPEVNEPDVPAESSPATPSEGEPETEEPESEAASEPALVEQPKPGETPEQKSERKKRNDENRWRRLTREAAEAKAERDLLKQQLAEKAAPAPARQEEKLRLNERPKRPKMSEYQDADSYDAAMEAYDEKLVQWTEQISESKVQNLQARTEADRSQQAFERRLESARAKNREFDKLPYFAEDFPASDAMNFVIRYDDEGLDYVPTLTRAEAKRIADLTTIKDFDKLLASNPTSAAYQLGVARTTAKIEMAKLVKPAAAPPRQPTGLRASSEISLDRRSAPVGDVRGKAIAAGDLATFRAIENEKLFRR